MRRITFIIALLLTISLWGATVPSNEVWAASSHPATTFTHSSTDPTPITLAATIPDERSSPSATASRLVIDIRDNRLSLRADGAGIREILKALEAKTGTRYIVHEGVPDEQRTLNLPSVSLHDTETLLQNLSLNNYIITYDRQEAHAAIYILPEGRANRTS